MELHRYPAGIDTLDSALEGGFLQGSLILLEYDTGSPKDIITKAFLKSGLDSGEQIYAVLTDSKINPVFDEEELRKFSKADFAVVDGFTNAFSWSEVKPHTEHRVDDISDIKNVHGILRNAVKGFDNKKHTRGLIDSVSTLLMAENYSKHRERQIFSSIPKYLLHQSVMCKDTGSILMCTLHQGAQDGYVERMIENISDYVLRIETKDNKRGYQKYLSLLTSRNHLCLSAKYEIAVDNKNLIVSGV